MPKNYLSFMRAAMMAIPLFYTFHASAGNYKTCIKFQIKTVDSGLGITNGPNTGGKEDYYLNANAGEEVIARGVRVQMSNGNWNKTFDSNPSTGCFSWSHAATSGFSLRVYGYATDSAGNYVRIHNSPNSFTSYPGQTYSILRTNLTPTNGGVDTYSVGSYDQKWTTMAVLAFSLYRFHPGLTNKAIHVGLDDSKCGGSSAHYGKSNSSITSGRHYLIIGNCASGGTPQSKRKFVVTHELGHALAALYYGSQVGAVNGSEPNVNDYSHPAQGVGLGPKDSATFCSQSSPFYSMRSIEWNSVGFREGFAHFVAAAIWNNQSYEGAFRWFEGLTYDLERYNYGNGDNNGGRLENECGTPFTDAGTNEDWLRFLWDWYTNRSTTCPQKPSALDMMKLYAQVRLNGGLTSKNYFDKMQTAANNLIHLPSCLRTSRFDAYAVHNGINN
ncbi:MAG: hypothetical protein WAW36_16885 [Methylovulum miyakonense]|uniref:hypothetical protein n=1 Tax=Methylovulum miyakonense TaxID=645578 RepID=UPI003BB76B02